MKEKPKKRFVTQKWLLENYVTWSEPTLRRRINEQGFPVIQDTGGRMYDLDAVDLWFKKRTGDVA